MQPVITDEVRLAAIRMKLMEAEKLLYESNKILMFLLDQQPTTQALVEPECQE